MNIDLVKYGTIIGEDMVLIWPVTLRRQGLAR
jgi:hypothetical protein